MVDERRSTNVRANRNIRRGAERHLKPDSEQSVNLGVNSFSQDPEDLEKMTEAPRHADPVLKEDVRSMELLQHLAEGTAAVTGSDFFRSLVHHLASALDVYYAFVTQCTDESLTRVRTRAVWMGKEFGENFEYTLAGTPCENVINGTVCYYPNSLQTLFPSDVGLKEWGTESFLGIPIRDSYQNVLGHIAIFDREPMAEKPHGLSVLKIFAARAGAEMERERMVHNLRKSEERFRALFESAPIGVSINDPTGKFLHLNRSFQEILGYPEEELKRMNFRARDYSQSLWRVSSRTFELRSVMLGRTVGSSGQIQYVRRCATMKGISCIRLRW